MPSRYSQLHKEEPNTSIYTYVIKQEISLCLPISCFNVFLSSSECMGTTSIEVTPVISATAEKDSDPN